MDPRWIHPFTACISGPTGCGKTVFVNRFISNLAEMMTPLPEEILWCYGEWQDVYTQLQEKGVIFIEGFPNFKEFDGRKKRLIIIDDLMDEVDSSITKLFTKGSHHRNLSVIHIVQNLFCKNKEQRTISLNCHYLILFNPRDKQQISTLGRQMYPGQSLFMIDAFKLATEQGHGYLLVDLKQCTPEHLRLRTSIFPGEQHTVFIPKNDRKICLSGYKNKDRC